MASNPANEIASAIQSVHLVRNPDIDHDLNPSTAASKKIPANIISPTEEKVEGSATSQHQLRHQHRHHRTYSSASASSTSTTTSTIPSDIIAPRPRRATLPPFPDFRFEQSYLNSIKSAESNWQVAYITFRDQLIWPLISGVAYNLLMFGWRHWNRESKFKGAGLGAKLRKWWWGVNNWKLPNGGGTVRANRDKLADEASEFFLAKVGSAQGE